MTTTTDIKPTIASTSFVVDDVKQNRTMRFNTKPLSERIVASAGKKKPAKEASMSLMRVEPEDPYRVLGVSHNVNVLVDDYGRGGHPIIWAVHEAFEHHLPLTFSPDMIWQVMAQGLSHHISMYPEQHREFLVKHKDKAVLTIFRPDLSLSDTTQIAHELPSITREFVEIMEKDATEAYVKLFKNEFSTTTQIERTAAAITCMEAFSPYYAYQMLCGCGFPKITLRGTTEDWMKLKIKVNQIEELFALSDELNLTWWTRRLHIVIDQFIIASQGNPDIEWWKKMYKQVDVYLSHYFNGWIGWLWPYTKTREKLVNHEWIKPETEYERNPMLIDLPNEVEITQFSFSPSDDKRTVQRPVERLMRLDMSSYPTLPFMSTGDFPSNMAKADLKIKDIALNQELDTVLVGGFVGISQDEEGGLVPEIGYGLLA